MKYEEQMRTWEKERQHILIYHLTHPELSMSELGKHFGKSKQRISLILQKMKLLNGVE